MINCVVERREARREMQPGGASGLVTLSYNRQKRVLLESPECDGRKKLFRRVQWCPRRNFASRRKGICSRFAVVELAAYSNCDIVHFLAEEARPSISLSSKF